MIAQKNKTKRKAESLMVSYVLIIIIGLALAGGVYIFLKYYLPSSQPECPEDIHLAVNDAFCSYTSDSLVVNVSNRGLFNVSAFYVRFGTENVSARQTINQDPFIPVPIGPGGQLNMRYNVTNNLRGISTPTNFIVEVQPAILTKKKVVACQNAITIQPVVCTNALGPAPGGLNCYDDPDCMGVGTGTYCKNNQQYGCFEGVDGCAHKSAGGTSTCTYGCNPSGTSCCEPTSTPPTCSNNYVMVVDTCGGHHSAVDCGAAGGTCENGACTTPLTCTNEAGCSAPGTFCTSASGQQYSCSLSGGCLVKSNILPCPYGCNLPTGTCCELTGASSCSGNNIIVQDSCGASHDLGACNTGLVCQNGACVIQGSGGGMAYYYNDKSNPIELLKEDFQNLKGLFSSL